MRRTRRLLTVAVTVLTFGVAGCSTAGVPGISAGGDGDGGEKVLYLTFDDGPSSQTVSILEVLREHDAKAVFFAVGQNLTQRGDIARRIVADGHVLANHTWNHADLTGLDDAGFDRELGQTSTLLAQLGAGSTCVRPPHGFTDDDVERELHSRGMRQVMWNVDTEDWTEPGAGHIAGQLLQADRGDVVLMHDGGGDRSQTVQALREALPALAERGYVFDIVPGC